MVFDKEQLDAVRRAKGGDFKESFDLGVLLP